MNSPTMAHPETRQSSGWALQMKATTAEEPSRLIQILTGALLANGGWVLSRGATDLGVIGMLFEFERHRCVDIYTVLIAVGLELSQQAHIRLTELCKCTRNQIDDCGSEIVSIDIEIHSFPMHTATRINVGNLG